MYIKHGFHGLLVIEMFCNRKALLFVIVLLAGMGSAAGVILSENTSIPDPVLLNHYVNVSIENGAAVVSQIQEFRNIAGHDMTGEFIFPLPEGGISDYSIEVSGKTYEAKIKNATEAANEYRTLVMERKDASLLKLVNSNTLSSAVFLPANRTVSVSMHYRHLVQKKAGMYVFSYPLHPERYTVRPIDPINITVFIRADGNLSIVYSPTHPITYKKNSPNEAVANYYESNVVPNKDFLLFFGTVESENDIKLLTHRKNGEEGYFLLFLYPALQSDQSIPQDIVFVIDRSGSMSGEKLSTAKKALKEVLGKLGKNDRFNIISFSDEVEEFSSTLEDPSKANDAANYVDSLYAAGGTNLLDPQIMAADLLGENDGRTKTVVFLTDGVDTTSHPTDFIMKQLKEKRISKNWRIYPFGIGRDLSFDLLSGESNEFGDGIPVYVETGSDLERAMTGFYQRISVPALLNPMLNLSAFAYDVYPKKLDNLYAENGIMIAGMYNNSGKVSVQLNGLIGKEQRTWSYLLDLPGQNDNPFVERVWASRKIGYLMDQINLEGESETLKKQVAFLGNRYALATPYTSLLVAAQEKYQEEKASGRVSGSLAFSGYDISFDDIEAHGDGSYAILAIHDASGNSIGRIKVKEGESYLWTAPDGHVYDVTVGNLAPGYTFGSKWVDVSMTDVQDMTSAGGILNQGEALSGAEYTGASAFKSGNVNSMESFRILGAKEVGDKTFIRIGSVWTDTSCAGNESVEKVEWGSGRYEELMKDDDVSGYLPAGEDTIICFSQENHALQIFTGNSSNSSNYQATVSAIGAQNYSIPISRDPSEGILTSNSSSTPEPSDVQVKQPLDDAATTTPTSKGIIETILDFFASIFNELTNR